MNRLSRDISRCVGKGCEERESCLRHAAIKTDKHRKDSYPFSLLLSLKESDWVCRSRIAG